MTSIVGRPGRRVGGVAGFAAECWKGDGSSCGPEFWAVMVLLAAAPSQKKSEARGKLNDGLCGESEGIRTYCRTPKPREADNGWLPSGNRLEGSDRAPLGVLGVESGGTSGVASVQ